MAAPDQHTPFKLLRWFAGLSALVIALIALTNAWVISSFLTEQLFQRFVSADTTINSQKLRLGNLDEREWGLFTEATLRTIALPAGRSMLLASFARLESALQCVGSVMATNPSACELLDRRLLGLARTGECPKWRIHGRDP